MANPQPDKFLKIALELAEQFAKHRLSGQEWQIMWVVLRKTYGWKKKSDRISLGQFAKATGIRRFRCPGLLARLVARNMLVRGVTQKYNTKLITYGLQKDYDKWRVLPKTAAVTQKCNRVLPKSATGVLPKSVPTIDKYKDTLTKDILSDKSDHQAIVSFWCEKYEKVYGVKYAFSGGKDGTIIKRLLKVYGKPKLTKIIEAMFDSNDPFYESRGDKCGGRTIGILSGTANKLAQGLAEKEYDSGSSMTQEEFYALIDEKDKQD